MVVTYVIKIKGIKTINHEMIVMPLLHIAFRTIVKIIITINLKKACIVSPRYISIII